MILIKEYINKNEQGLKELIIQMRRQAMNLRFQKISNPVSDNSTYKKVRRDIARLKTVVRAKQLNLKGF